MCYENTQFAYLLETVRTLRGENGCPWDKRQTTSSMKKYLKSEFEELLYAIENEDVENIKEELGDLMFILVMISEINSSEKKFTVDDVISTINEKLIRRHPHVFGELTVESEEELRAQWNRIKAEEKAKKN